MAQHRPLQVYAIEDLLILLWRRQEKLANEINIVLNGIPLARPLIGVEFPEQPYYLLAARAPGLDARRRSTVSIVSDDQHVLIEAECEKPRPLSAKIVASWSIETRARVERALIRQVGVSFPGLGVSAREQIGAALAETHVLASAGPGGRTYVRIPWTFSQSSSLLDVSLKPLLQNENGPELVEPLKALAEGPWLHFFSRHSAEFGDPNRIWVLEAGKSRCVPFRIKDAGWETRTGGDWVEKIVADYPGNREVLKAYAGMMLNPPRPRTERPRGVRRLLGKVEGLRAGALVGWALDFGAPESPVRLRIALGGQVLQEVEAYLPRPDVKPRDYSNCGFAWKPDPKWLNGEPYEFRVVCSETGEELDGSPVRVGRGQYDGGFRLDDEGCLAGWVRERTSVPGRADLRLVIDEELAAETPFRFFGGGEGEDTGLDGEGRLEFRAALPDRVFDTTSHSLALEIMGVEGSSVRLEQVLRVKADYRGHVDRMGTDRLAGWIFNTVAPRRPVVLDLLVNGRPVSRFTADRVRTDLEGEHASQWCGFEIRVPPPGPEGESQVLEIGLAGTSVRVLGPPILHLPYEIALRSLNTLAAALNDGESWRSLSGGLAVDDGVRSWLRSHVVARLLAELRRAKSFPAEINLPLAAKVTLPQRQPREAVVDVILPVHGARGDTLECIASVLTAGCATAMELVVINDASPDPELNAELRRLAAEHRFLLLENPANLGFVVSVNRGMRLHPGRDVVLLNSDTVLPRGWLDRLRKSAYGARNIGTATPFSNNATICSFPVICRENALPEGISLDRLDTLFAQANSGRSVDLPTAVGFCMYIRRDALDEVDYFDEGRWGKGYGEENDFCLRAAALGWRHVAACDVFVEHKGARSFAEGKREHLKRNLAKLDALYPDYARTIQRFIAQDPLAGPRNRVIKELLKAHADSYLLFLMHHLGGGTQVAVDDLAARLGDEGIAVLELRCVAPDRWRLSGRGRPYTMDYRYPTDFDALVQDLRDLGVWHIHCHHTLGFPRKSLELPALLGTEYDVTVHDYLPICPRINLIDESGVYCGDAQYSVETCDGCIQVNGPHPDVAGQYSEFGGHMAGWRAGYGDYLRGARRVFAPSRDTARRLRRHFQLLNLRVEPHPEPLRKIPGILRQGKSDTVAVLGAIGPHKGFDILLKCVRNAAKERLPLKFVVIGFTSDDDALKNYGNVTITGEYKSADLPGLIASGGARVALFLSPWPETYSFTLSEAWQNQLFPVAFDLGAIAERIKKAQWGRLMPLTTEPKLINRVLLEVLSEERPVPETSTMGRTLRSVLKDYYRLHKPRSRTVVPVELNALMGSGAGA